jgi:hypothetical protein
MKNCFLILTIILLATSSVAQQNIITGKVIDANTKLPIPFASVFFASTSIGSSTKEDGTFLLEKFPDSRYNLTVSYVGYQTYQLSIDFGKLDQLNHEILLKEISFNLNEVVLLEDTIGRQKNLEDFKKCFLGTTKNSQKCIIVNPKSLHLYFDSQTDILFAHTKEPIIVENRALGYRITYFSDMFEFHRKEGTIYAYGNTVFEPLRTKKANEQKKWEANREDTYSGSVLHFFRSLSKNELIKNGFDVRKVFEVHSSAKSKPEYVDSIAISPISGHELFEIGSMSKINYKGKLIVTYKKEREEEAYVFQMRKMKRELQTSKISFLEEGLIIYPNGSYENPKSVIVEGYWGWSENMADLLPVNYELPIKK